MINFKRYSYIYAYNISAEFLKRILSRSEFSAAEGNGYISFQHTFGNGAGFTITAAWDIGSDFKSLARFKNTFNIIRKLSVKSGSENAVYLYVSERIFKDI